MRSRSDTNQPEIIDTLRAIGAVVEVVSQKAIGCDLIVEWQNRAYLVEVKHSDEKYTLSPNETRVKALFGESYLVIDSAESFIKQTETTRRFDMDALCYGADFAVLIKFNLRTQKREVAIYGRDQERRSRAMRLADAIFRNKKMFKGI